MHIARLNELYHQKSYTILPIKSGMLLELHENVGEGDVNRVQKFKGLVIQVKKPHLPDGTFTIRGTVAGVIVEKIFPLSFPKFAKIILLDQFQTRRSRINYIRDKVGKGAKMKSIITVDIKETDILATMRNPSPKTTETHDQHTDATKPTTSPKKKSDKKSSTTTKKTVVETPVAEVAPIPPETSTPETSTPETSTPETKE